MTSWEFGFTIVVRAFSSSSAMGVDKTPRISPTLIPMITLIVGLLYIVTLVIFILGMPISIRASYNRARRKGYYPISAGMIVMSPWVLGTVAASIWEWHRFRIGAASGFGLLIVQWILLLTAPSVDVVLVRALPRRVARVSGPRRVPFSLVGRTWLIVVVWLVLALAIPSVLWLAGEFDAEDFMWVSGAATFFGLSLGIIYSFWLGRYDRAIKSPLSVEKYLTDDPRSPVLYLRPFQMEAYGFVTEDGRDVNFEGFFWQALRELGPFVALGNPEDYAPVLQGAVRLYASDADWIQKLGELARQSSCIVAETARADNLRTEYAYLRREGMQDKLFVFTGHPEWGHRPWLQVWGEKARFGILRVDWEVFSEDLSRLGYDLHFRDPGLGSVITFDAGGRGLVLTTQAETPAEFVEPIRAWVERRERIGRCMPTLCLSCGQEFHVFPADIPVIRERWCRKCDVGLNAFQRAVKRYGTRHQTLRAWVCLICFFIIPMCISSILFDGRGWLEFLFLILEICAIYAAFVWASFRKDRRLGRRYQNLAEAGDAVAMTNLGIMYRPGGALGDRTSAAVWFRKAAQAGDIGGMVNLADMLDKGIGGLQKDANEAVCWYQRAADLGSLAAQRGLDRLKTTNLSR
jgi:Sel1 repeat